MPDNEFSSTGLSLPLLQVVQELGFLTMTPIQRESIPVLMAGSDLIGQSKTGSGKTAAFVLPILNQIDLSLHGVQALILCPTRELAAQVVGDIRKLGRRLDGLQVLATVGGASGRDQREALERGVHVVVGTPGRVADLLDKLRMDLGALKTLVFDEADKMLEMGFENELQFILKQTPKRRQTVFFSATFPESILSLSKTYQKNPVQLKIENEKEEEALIEALVYDCEADEKNNFLMRILQQHPSNSTIVFCNMKVTVNELTENLLQQEISCGALHGDMEQRERDQVMTMFRNGSYKILIATDVAARGLDIDNLELVINFDFPKTPDVYVHRIGRTGRAGKKGTAVTLANARDTIKLAEIESLTKRKFVRRSLGFKNQHGLGKALRESAMKTISISGGRKDKLRAGDILGALTGAAGLDVKSIGKIEIQDKHSYVAVSASVADQALEALRLGKIKGQKFQVRFMTRPTQPK